MAAGRQIRVLPPALCNQIAAGEVVERPSSAVKELIENAIDAGATKVFVDLEEGGRALLQVTDNGHGMNAANAELALQRHATSKIAKLEDLTAIGTLGFRGEALASIASVSKLKLVTQEHESDVGVEITVEGGAIVDQRAAAAPPGTRISVRQLFYNTPARLKFLKRASSELRRVQSTLQQLALIYPAIHFRLTHDGRKRLDLPPHEDPTHRILAVLGRDTYEGIFPIEPHQVKTIRTTGFFTRPSLNARNRNQQFVFVNNRYISDRTVSAAIAAAYRGLTPKGRYPIVILHLEVPLEAVDVNVHPAKIEVRFSDSDSVFRSVYHALQDGLAATPWVGEIERAAMARQLPGAERVREELTTATSPKHAPDPPPSQPQQGFLDSLYSAPRQPSSPSLPPPTATSASSYDSFRAFDGLDSSHPGPPPGASPGPIPERPEGAKRSFFSRLRFIGQFNKTYLLCSQQDALVIVDQHAAHERISFERLRQAWSKREPEGQRLLFPTQLELDALRAATLEEYLEFFGDIGFEIEPFGGNSFALKSVPTVIKGAQHLQVIRDALDDLSNNEQSSRVDEAIDSVLSRIACHGSVRAGDRLSEDEAYALFAQMDEIDFSANCPHGRPVYFVMGLDEIEKRFDRI